MTHRLSPALLLLICGATDSTLANDRLEEIIVTSSRVEMPLRQVGTSVSVIDNAEIRTRGFANLAEVLQYEPAISLTNTGGQGKATSLRIRGENGYRTKVLMDGIEITDVSAPQAGPLFEHLLSAGTERVEILRGPQGMMYGADAGGVVNIQTLRPQTGVGGSLGGEFGRYDTYQYGGHLGAGNESVDAILFGTYYETAGFNSRTTDTELRDRDGYENTTLHGRAGWNMADTLRAEVVGHTVEGENEFDDCFTVDTFAPTDDCSDDYRQDASRASLTYGGEVFTHQLAYNLHQTDRDFRAAGISSFTTEGELGKLEYIGSWNPSADLKLVYGADVITESMDDGSFDTRRDQNGYYLEYQGRFGANLYLTAGLRHDDNDDFDAHTTYRASAAYLFTLAAGELQLRGTYGTGYRAPSLYEIAYNRGDFAYPPASGVELEAEKSAGYDLGVAFYAGSGWFVEAIYFDQQIDDEIFFDLLDFSGYLQGDGESTSRGIELSGALPLGDALLLTGNYTYNDTEDADGFQRLRVPEQMANLGLGYRLRDGRLSINLFLHVSRDAIDGLGEALDDYETLNLTASYRVRDSLEVYGRVENLTDENYEMVPTYNTPGAAGYTGLRYSF